MLRLLRVGSTTGQPTFSRLTFTTQSAMGPKRRPARERFDACTVDAHPDAIACRLKLSYATLGCRATMPCPWKVAPWPLRLRLPYLSCGRGVSQSVLYNRCAVTCTVGSHSETSIYP